MLNHKTKRKPFENRRLFYLGRGKVELMITSVSLFIHSLLYFFIITRRVAGKATETERMRPPRYVDKTLGIIQPYCTRKAFGAGVLYVSG